MSSQAIESNRKCLDRLFLRLTVSYGQLWRSQFKSDEFLAFAKKEWGDALSEFEVSHIEEATTLCCKTKEFPPTLPQFIDLCKSFKNKGKIFKPEQTVTKTLSIGEEYLRGLRQSLGLPLSKERTV